MIRTGEDTGTLHKVMPRLADYYDEEIEKHVQKTTTIMEPILLVVVGGIIGVIVISLILPIFKLTKSIH
jgi:type II secretory pathway component PulF